VSAGTIRRLALVATLLLTSAALPAQAPRFELTRIARPTDADAIPLYPAGSLPAGDAPERWGRLIGHFPDGTVMDARIARNVSIPTMTPVLPDPIRATGAAVIVAPGGAYLSLSMDSEGFAVARWLADHGIAAFVLKYRLNPSPDDETAFMGVVGQRMSALAHGDTSVREPRAVADALRAIELVRAGAGRWKVDPARVGLMGFSAGARTTLQAVLTADASAQPAFVGYIYGAMLPVAVPSSAPPMFAALALDDPLYGKQGFGIVEAWQKAGHPVEIHAYERGNHGFGTGRKGTTTTLMLDEFRLWLASRGLLEGPGK
jgi:acetyl esterase/lipase